MSINNVIITGRAGRDPELRHFESGSAVASLTIAVDRNKADEPCDWFDVELWGKAAQAAAEYVRKGSRIGLEGRLQQQKWTDRASGQQRSKVVVNAYRLELLDSKADAEARQQRQASGGGGWPQGQSHAQSNAAPAWQGSGGAQDDVPF